MQMLRQFRVMVQIGDQIIQIDDRRDRQAVQVKSRKVTHAARSLRQRYQAYCDNELSFAEFDASVQGWINHVRFADSWGLRQHVLRLFRIKPGDLRQKSNTALRRCIKLYDG
ncbi:hypothetical protein, partial [Nitrosomonas sp.]|uniref:hypothetical protein n=1 Tax=Nitrosomonas sp. TaxID=42353 RepID=UPI001DA6921B